jgi:hypothetical protein
MMATKSISFGDWWEEHKTMVSCSEAEAKAIYESALLDVADWIEAQKNDVPSVGRYFADTIRLGMKG